MFSVTFLKILSNDEIFKLLRNSCTIDVKFLYVFIIFAIKIQYVNEIIPFSWNILKFAVFYFLAIDHSFLNFFWLNNEFSNFFDKIRHIYLFNEKV
jgi:hypothetical protein